MNQDFGEASTKELQCWSGDCLHLFSVICLTLGIYNGKRFVLAHVSEISEHGIGIYMRPPAAPCAMGKQTHVRQKHGLETEGAGVQAHFVIACSRVTNEVPGDLTH